MTSATSIIVLEDNLLIAMSVRSTFARAKHRLGPYGDGVIHIEPSGRRLLHRLGGQPAGSVMLILIDYSIADGVSSTSIAQIWCPQVGRRHPALHPEARLIGWSANEDAAVHFRALGLDGSISKHRPVINLAADVSTILEQRQAGKDWVDLY